MMGVRWEDFNSVGGCEKRRKVVREAPPQREACRRAAGAGISYMTCTSLACRHYSGDRVNYRLLLPDQADLLIHMEGTSELPLPPSFFHMTMLLAPSLVAAGLDIRARVR